jgi:hypothetical protein
LRATGHYGATPFKIDLVQGGFSLETLASGPVLEQRPADAKDGVPLLRSDCCFSAGTAANATLSLTPEYHAASD